MKNSIINNFTESIKVKQNIIADALLIKAITEAVNLILLAYKNNNKLLIAGNGGSASDSQHMAAELVGRFLKNRKALAAIALTTDTSIITSVANDFSFEEIFSKQLEANGKTGDVFLAISTSGNSKNIIKAVEYAKQNGIFTIALTGSGGGTLKNLAKLSLVVHQKIRQEFKSLTLQ